MKVIKRDGRVVDYDRAKIKLAIEKANKEVMKKEKATKEDVKKIIAYIEELRKKRILVEDIQDIIEQKLMELDRYELAKKYIVYRYNRALIRKSNTTDASILGLLRNASKKQENKEIIKATVQRNFIVGEVSKDLSKRILLPEKITKAWENGILYFHDSEYFIQPIINSCYVNIKDMLDNGTMINGKKIESPKSFQVACIIMTQIIATIANNQYGKQIIDINALGKYLKRSKEKYIKELENEKIDQKIKDRIIENRLKNELKSGVQTIQYQLNTLVSITGKTPEVKIYLYADENDEYKDEVMQIIQECLNQKQILQDENIEYITEQNMEKDFNIGIVSINLPQIVLETEFNEDEFWKQLEYRMEMCKDALMYRYYALLGTTANISPIHWIDGAISRLENSEKIDIVLQKGNLILNCIGLNELKLAFPQLEINKLNKYFKERAIKWQKENGITFKITSDLYEDISREFLHIDKEKYGTVENITDKEKYTNN